MRGGHCQRFITSRNVLLRPTRVVSENAVRRGLRFFVVCWISVVDQEFSSISNSPLPR